ncbi:MAG TPA: glycosyltransferase family 4 protein [Candidatus Sulfotelmatobacter sp.]|nr:glycosyltransferase family 4 protein [Candidatus Sulfotelmatobacter sp.]
MRVLQIHKTFHARGGADTFFFKTCGLLTERGHEVAHFSTLHPNNVASPFSGYFVKGFTDADVAQMGLRRKASAFIQGIYSTAAKTNLQRLVNDFKPDVSHAHCVNYQLSPSVFDVFRHSDVPLFATLHDFTIICGAGTLQTGGAFCERCKGGHHHNLLLHNCYWNFPASLMATLSHYLHDFRRSWDSVTKLLIPSRFMLEKLVEWGIPRERLVHLPIFIDFSEQAQAEVPGEYVLYFGRIDEHKGVKVLLEAVRGLDCKLILIGDGPLTPWLEEQITGGVRNVQRLPFVSSREQLRNYIAGAAFTVVPSTWYENQPAVVLETYAMSKPVIGSRIGGIPELVDDGHTGLLANPGDPADLREKIEFLLARPTLAQEWGRNGSGMLRAGFSRGAHYDRLMAIYEAALHSNSEPETLTAISI